MGYKIWYVVLCCICLSCIPAGFSAEDGTVIAEVAVDMMKRLHDKNDPGLVEDIGSPTPPIVQTTSGLIYGVTNNHTHSFYSIPYAVPPVGNLRFQPPKMLDTPDITRQLGNKTKVYCVKPGYFNEDCLVLNVFSPLSIDLLDPALPPQVQLPVLVFIHGGAFFTGSGTGEIFDGRYLSQITNTVIVTVNYRLGPLGFLVFNEGEYSFNGNQGLKDQRIAMQWVQKNIEKFGGDKTKITLFGESAGAQSVMFHLVSEISEPLFNRAIMESNPASYRYPVYQEALAVTNRLVDNLRCNAVNAGDCCLPFKSNYTCLMEASAETLVHGMIRIMASEWAQLDPAFALEPFRPYIDEIEFSDQPINLIQNGKWAKYKPVIIGSNEEEALFLESILPLDKVLYESLNKRLFEGLGTNNNTGDMISEKYMDMYPGEDHGHIFGIEMTDIWFACPTRALARFLSETTENSIYYYIFDHALDGEDCEERLGFLCGHSYHSAELYFVFRTIEHVGMIPDDHDILVSNQFSTYWGNMAWSGDPSIGPGFGLEGEFPEWLKYTKTNERNSQPWTNIRFANPNAYLETTYREDICDFWDTLGIYPAPVYMSEVSSTTKAMVELTTSGELQFEAGSASLVMLILTFAANLLL